MASEEYTGNPDAGLIRERLLADYVDIWEYVFKSDDFVGWAYDNEFSRLYVHAAPQCGKVSAQSIARLAQRSRQQDNVLSGRG
jgi:hypothetical protein